MTTTSTTTRKRKKSGKDRSVSPSFSSPSLIPPPQQQQTEKQPTMSEKLTPLEFSLALGRALDLFARILAKYWTDEKGLTPLGRFFHFDRPFLGLGPPRRVVFYGLLGFFLSVIAMVVTEDEYYTGPKLDKDIIAEQTEMFDFFPVYVSFDNLGCYVQGVGQIIANISGDARPGQLTAILGASGSGKTTFAHALLGRNRRSCTGSSGTVYLNGEPGTLDSFLDRVGFVPQNDVLYAELTVLEALEFSARFRLPRYLSEESIQKIIRETIETLDLGHVIHQRIGDKEKKRGLSGGEQKRVSIGVELVAMPSVLVLDEPTSGLDGAQAHKLIGTLKFIANRYNVSVLTVIHQPSTRSFSLFDNIILLQKGRLVLSGERNKAISYFRSLPSLSEYFSENQTTSNPAEILLDVTTGFAFLELDYIESDFFREQKKGIRDRERQYRQQYQILEQQVETLLLEEVRDVKEKCGGYRSELLRTLCNIKMGLQNTLGLFVDDDDPRLKYSKRPRSGIVFQTYQWFVLLWRLAIRRGIRVELGSLLILAGVCGYLRHFNRSWQRRQIGVFYISVSLGMVAMMGAAMEDDILPVRRAIGAGMLLGAHEWALVLHSLCKSIASAHLFSLTYFAIRYSLDPPPSAVAMGEVREFICTPFSISSYFQFAHLLQINYGASRAFGLLVSVLVDHDQQKALVSCCALLIAAHSFSLFTPQSSQLVKDGVNVFGVSLGKPMLFLCSFSYVRYFLEAVYLWDPDKKDRIGREFTLRHYSYREGTEAACATTIILFTVIILVIRFVVFAFRNANDYASFHDAPAFLIFLSKIIGVYFLLLIFSIVFHEWDGIKVAWSTSVKAVMQNTRGSPSVEKIGENEMIETFASPRQSQSIQMETAVTSPPVRIV